jgi:hypothetical protein
LRLADIHGDDFGLGHEDEIHEQAQRFWNGASAAVSLCEVTAELAPPDSRRDGGSTPAFGLAHNFADKRVRATRRYGLALA